MCSRKKFHQDFEAEKSNPDVVKLPQFILFLLLSEVRLFYHPHSYFPPLCFFTYLLFQDSTSGKRN